MHEFRIHDICLPIGRFAAVFSAETEVRLPAYAGSAWRGAFGHSLKRALCVTRLPACSDCLLFRSCAYAYIFETPPPAQALKMRKYPSAPHPFVLGIDMQEATLTPGSRYRLGFTLIGRANQSLPYMIHAFQQAGEMGVGTGHGRMRMEKLERYQPDKNCWATVYVPGEHCDTAAGEMPDIPPVPDAVTLNLETPLRLKRDGEIIGVGDFTFGALFAQLLRRISMLTYFHTETPLETDFSALTQAARGVQCVKANLRWFDWKRYSSRQKREMAVGGLLGEITFSGADIEPFWPFLWLGQYVHVGALTSMGLGRYRIEMAASLPSRTGLDLPAENVHP
jgi:hypothetical protein